MDPAGLGTFNSDGREVMWNRVGIAIGNALCYALFVAASVIILASWIIGGFSEWYRRLNLMYVYNPRESDGYLFRAPEWICKLFVSIFRRYDYWPNPHGGISEE